MTARAHLGVSRFLATEWDARAIKAALDFGLVDTLQKAPMALERLAEVSRIAPRGLALLVDLLLAGGVLAREGELLRLTPEFAGVLRFRDLLETRIAFADLVWPDIHTLFDALLTDVPRFMARSRTFELFRYDRCFEPTAANLAATQAWTRFTTCLTKYEAAAALDEIDLGGVSRLVDLGGNTGEFALAFCRRAVDLRATVVDLPVVCEVGRRHIAETAPEHAGRIVFQACDMRRDALPAPADLLSFKSVLHDWPDEDARHLLSRARDIVRPGGRLMIFERAPLSFAGRPAYGLAPDLVFLHFLRGPQLYLDTLQALGFVDVSCRRIALEVDFHLIVARRPSEPDA